MLTGCYNNHHGAIEGFALCLKTFKGPGAACHNNTALEYHRRLVLRELIAHEEKFVLLNNPPFRR